MLPSFCKKQLIILFNLLQAHLIAVDGRLYQQLIDIQSKIRNMAGQLQNMADAVDIDAEDSSDLEDSLVLDLDGLGQSDKECIEDALDEAMDTSDALYETPNKDFQTYSETTEHDGGKKHLLPNHYQNSNDSCCENDSSFSDAEFPSKSNSCELTTSDAPDNGSHTGDEKPIENLQDAQVHKLELSINDNGSSSGASDEGHLREDVDLDSLDEDEELSEVRNFINQLFIYS